MPSLNGSNDPPERLWGYGGAPAAEDQPADYATSLVSLGFIRAAIRRSARFWCAMAIVGLLIGAGLYIALPPAYQASTSVLLTLGPYENPGTAAQDDQAIAQSRTVAGLALRKLGLRQSVSSFVTTYTVTIVSTRVLLFTVNSPSSNDAVSRAGALAAEFLQFRAGQLEAEEGLMLGALDQQLNQARQRIKSITAQIGQLSAQPASSARQAQLSNLQAERSQQTTKLTTIEQDINGNQVSIQAATTSAVQGSKVLDAAAPLPHSRLKHLLLYPVAGLILGLALGMAIVVIRALLSDRLRQRDDVADALGAPVKLSVRAVRLSRWLPGRRGLAAARSRDMRRIVAHLRRAVPGRKSRRVGALAVVAVDNAEVAALSLASLAVSFAEEGRQVVVADLTTGAHAGRLLGAGKPGIRTVTVNGRHLLVVLPDRDTVVPIGPLHRASAQAQSASSGKLAAACASADVLLTLATLDPSLGGEHLSTWATDAVVMVTAGRSSWVKIHAVGEMVRLAGTRLVSAVLVGADKTDESLGLTYTPGDDLDADVVEGSVTS